ncbi:NAD(P)H-dependent oxidoreductase [Herbaspirillum lusitanum]|jgi:glutathione-regulated potassium-efflux system ancillary protein KefF|uniref:NAD(P)H-dependent oxidoreductase n=1 Tax=Herbaspirillum lusitanum TaxID=213312 RepID=A0ABW9A5I9_9BURK
MSKPRILILYAHPAAHRSRANRLMIEAVQGLDHVQVHDLYESYPDFHLDVRHEQQLLSQSDLIVLQHPIHWYSMPALQKEWLDVVLQRGWAFGHDATALRGKSLWLAASTGGDHAAYQTSGRHGHSFDAFLPPYQQTAQLCGMRWLEPLVIYGAHQVGEAALEEHARRYRRLLESYPDWPAADAPQPTAA